MTKHTIEAKNIVKSYDGRKVVNQVSINLSSGEVVGLLGPNGAGKTTTFYTCVGLVAPNAGQILLDGKDITKEPVFNRARMGVGYLPQEASVFRKLSVEDNIMAILETIDSLSKTLATKNGTSLPVSFFRNSVHLMQASLL